MQSCVKGMDDKRLIEYADLIYDIIGAAHEVHNELHYGLSEAVYEEALCLELSEQGIAVSHQVDLPVFYKEHQLDKHYRLDIVVEDDIIIELKAVDKILSEHRAQLFNYLRITQKPIGLLLNFGKSVYVEKYISVKVYMWRNTYTMPIPMMFRSLVRNLIEGNVCLCDSSKNCC